MSAKKLQVQEEAADTEDNLRGKGWGFGFLKRVYGLGFNAQKQFLSFLVIFFGQFVR